MNSIQPYLLGHMLIMAVGGYAFAGYFAVRHEIAGEAFFMFVGIASTAMAVAIKRRWDFERRTHRAD